MSVPMVHKSIFSFKDILLHTPQLICLWIDRKLDAKDKCGVRIYRYRDTGKLSQLKVIKRYLGCMISKSFALHFGQQPPPSPTRIPSPLLVGMPQTHPQPFQPKPFQPPTSSRPRPPTPPPCPRLNCPSYYHSVKGNSTGHAAYLIVLLHAD